MKTEQVNLRLEADLISEIERSAQDENLDRGTMIRRLLLRGLSGWKVDRALGRYQAGEISMGRASEESGLSHWELIDLARAESSPHSYDARRTSEAETLSDRSPRPTGVLLIGLNPARVSAKAGHYYQGRLGKRLWRRLARLGLLLDATPGAEDDAFVAAGHGLTDIVRRATLSEKELSRDEYRQGVESLKVRIADWKPGLLLFVFRKAARLVTGDRNFKPGPGPVWEGIPTFLLSGPYADRNSTHRTDDALRTLIAELSTPVHDGAWTHAIRPGDMKAGILRLPREAKSYLPKRRGLVNVVLRGRRIEVSYDPRSGPDLERSGVLRIGREVMERVVRSGERLRVRRSSDGTIRLD